MTSSKSRLVAGDVEQGGGEVPRGASVLNADQIDQCFIWGYRRDWLRFFISGVCYILTGFLLRLVFHWRPDWHLYATHQQCNLSRAEKILLRDQYNAYFVHPVQLVTHDGTRVKVVKVGVLGILARWFSCEDRGESGDDVGSRTHLLDAASDSSLIRFIVSKKVKYIWNAENKCFERLIGLENVDCSSLHSKWGFTELEAARQRVIYGVNRILVPVTPVLTLILLTVLHPFYVFQIFSIILWYNDEYAMYATCIVVISVLSVGFTVFETHRNEVKLRDTVEGCSTVLCSRLTNTGSEEFTEIGSEFLVPGDVIEIPRHGCMMQCDAVLVSGNCIVNESMLTGEAVPVLKVPAPNPAPEDQQVRLNLKEHSRHVLFCGTRVIQTRYIESERVRAVVLRSGFLTAKGEMVRSIMFPKPVESKFDRDAAQYILLLSFFALCGFIYTIVMMVGRGYNGGKIALRALDLITIVVPPALPAAMTVGIVFAVQRLKRASIFCISPNTINLCGSLNVVCFDKTGTLTEDGLDMWGVLQCVEGSFLSPQHDTLNLERGRFLEAMAACHSLTRIEGVLSGDPLDLKMFQATGWQLEEPQLEDHRKFDMMVPTVVRPPRPDVVRGSEEDWWEDEAEAAAVRPPPYEIGIVRQLTFSSSLQRASVVARILGAKYFSLFTKGSPEMVASLCRRETLPIDFTAALMQYTRRGFRVLALAWRPLRISWVKAQKKPRESLERDLIFLGLLVMENRLKPETTPVVRLLSDAQIRIKMVTGDNMLTALSVARDCHMIGAHEPVIVVQASVVSGSLKVDFHYAEDLNEKVLEIRNSGEEGLRLAEEGSYHLALNGKTWAAISSGAKHLLPRLVVRGTVFSRFSPDQKSQLVESLQELGYYVGMCGDGANDCGALKTAHAGISLSEAEASVASPFTSKRQNVSCVPDLIREGRCALTTSFGIFKFMAGYSLTQFVSCLILYNIGANLTDGQFLFIDLFIITSLSITFGRTTAYPFLHPEPPSLRLVSLVTVLSICLQMLVCVAFQVVAFFLVRAQPWFTEFHMDIEDMEYASYENSAIFVISSFQYTTLAIVFSKSSPYRKTILSNWLFLVNILICIGVTIYTCTIPFEWLKNFMELWDMPRDTPSGNFKLILLGMVLANFLSCFVLETCVEAGALRRSWRRVRQRMLHRGLKEYSRVEDEIRRAHPAWPPITRSGSLADLGAHAEIMGADPPPPPLSSEQSAADLQCDDEQELLLDEDELDSSSNVIQVKPANSSNQMESTSNLQV